MCAVIAASAVWWLLSTPMQEGRAAWLQRIVLPAGVLANIILIVMREDRNWVAPSRKLARLLEACRAGDEPIDSLSEIGGGLSHLVPVAQAVLHDLRRQRQDIACLEEEIRQRIAQRTNALERQVGSLRAQATRDPLTGLFNRRMMDSTLPRMLERCVREGQDLTVLMIDVDYFKQLNDSLGHAKGDELLRAIAQVLRSGLREGDIPVRCGGDEFVVLLPNCPLHAGKTLGQRLATTVDGLVKTLHAPLPPGLSVGSSSLQELRGTTLDISELAASLLAMADKDLYEKKAARKAIALRGPHAA